jgi:hypothetical protein
LRAIKNEILGDIEKENLYKKEERNKNRKWLK